jgi:hypothetical protein
MRTLKKRLFGKYSDHTAPPLASNSLVLRTLFDPDDNQRWQVPSWAYRRRRSRCFEEQHPDSIERSGGMEDEMSVLVKVADSTQGG